MNCKPGDLAFIVAPGRPADGMVVQCVKYLGVIRGLSSSGVVYKPRWLLDRYFTAFDGTKSNSCPDDCLRPIRDPGDDAVDEMVQKLGKPEGVPA